jgi:hypothetical protein
MTQMKSHIQLKGRTHWEDAANAGSRPTACFLLCTLHARCPDLFLVKLSQNVHFSALSWHVD